MKDRTKSWLTALAAFATGVAVATAQTTVVDAAAADEPADVQFEKAYEVLTRADDARDAGEAARALDLYRQALASYKALARRYPAWQPGVIRFRVTYCDTQLKAMERRTRQAGEAAGGPPRAVPRPALPPVATPVEMSDEGPDMVEEPSFEAERAREPLPEPQTPPDSIEVLKHRASALLKDTELKEAQSVIMEGLRRAPDDHTLRLLMGIARCQSGDYEDAFLVLDQLVQEAPSNAYAHVALGTTYFAMGELLAAGAEMQTALELSPQLTEACFNLAQIALVSTPPDVAAARRYYAQALEMGAPPDRDLERQLNALP